MIKKIQISKVYGVNKATLLNQIRAVALSLILLAPVLSSCVRSKVIVTSDPTDAVVTMNGVPLGETPVEHPFTWYWYYDFIATKEGYQAAGTRERFHAPPWLWPGFDLVMEMMPFYVTDTKRVHLVLEEIDQRPQPGFVDEPVEEVEEEEGINEPAG